MKNGKAKRRRIPRYGRTYKESLAIKRMLDKLPVVRYRTWKEAFTPEEYKLWRKTAR
ncbi:MAG: hypothetical protein HYY13_04125 [Nitrospirae bacterium]|nr:hypothetical protein [Nitrospirota bacterium]